MWRCPRCGEHNVGRDTCARCLTPRPAGAVERYSVLPPPHRNATAVSALAGIVAVLLVAGVVGVFLVDDDEPVAAVRSGGALESTTTSQFAATPSTSTPAPPPAGTPLEGVVRELQAFVEQTRGLKFKVPVQVKLLEDKAFETRLKEVSEEDVGELEKTAKVLRALYLLDRGVDLEKQLDSLLGAAVAGFYDPETDELVVRGAKTTPYVRTVLVHELTHALQDQHFDLDRPELDDRDDEASQAFSVVVEGDAVRIQEQYRRSLSRSERREADEEEESLGGDIGADIPDVLLQLIGFPYEVGPVFVRSVMSAGGQPRLDAAFSAPPVTSEHVLHPDAFLSGQPVASVADPPADAAVIDKGVIGELGIILMLLDDAAQGVAARAGSGWGGDRYVAWDQGAKTCVRAAFAMDTARDADELEDAFRDFADEHDDVRVDRGADRITLTSCN